MEIDKLEMALKDYYWCHQRYTSQPTKYKHEFRTDLHMHDHLIYNNNDQLFCAVEKGQASISNA